MLNLVSGLYAQLLSARLPAQEKVIELHELNHFALNHHLWAFIETLQAHVFWFNPLHHALNKQGVLCRG